LIEYLEVEEIKKGGSNNKFFVKDLLFLPNRILEVSI